MLNSNKHILILFFLISLLNYSGCGLNYSSDYFGSLKGVVRDSTTHLGLNGVRITTSPGSLDINADELGNFEIKNIPMSNSFGFVTLMASRPRYLTNTVSIKLTSDDTVNIMLALIPFDKVSVARGLVLNQFVDYFSFDAINLTNFFVERDIQYDVDVKFRNYGNLMYIISGYNNVTTDGFQTKFSPLLGKCTLKEFDTLASYYGASEPLDPITDFPFDNTELIPADNVRNNIFAFYLKGRYSHGNSYRIYGLMHIDSVWIAGTGLYKMLLDVKINTLGQNYFVAPY